MECSVKAKQRAFIMLERPAGHLKRRNNWQGPMAPFIMFGAKVITKSSQLTSFKSMTKGVIGHRGGL